MTFSEKRTAERHLVRQASEWIPRVGFMCDGTFGRGIITGIIVREEISIEVDTGIDCIIIVGVDDIENAAEKL